MSRTTGSYAVEGVVIQACEGMSPVRRGGRRLRGCTVTAWHIDRGSVGTVDVSGMTVVAVSRGGGGRARLIFFLTEKATPEQVRVVVDLLEARPGVVWSGCGLGAGADLGVYQMPMPIGLRSSRCSATRARFRVEACCIDATAVDGGPAPLASHGRANSSPWGSLRSPRGAEDDV